MMLRVNVRGLPCVAGIHGVVRGLASSANNTATHHGGGLMSSPRYTGIPTFFRAPHVDMHTTPAALGAVDIGVVGVPFDGGVTNRSGARDGPRAVRVLSAGCVRGVNQATGAAPFAMGLEVADVGDAHVDSPYELVASHNDIERHFNTLKDHKVTPVAVGGDHSVTLPILRALAKDGKVALIHIDAHADTNDDYAGSRFHHTNVILVPLRALIADVVAPQQLLMVHCMAAALMGLGSLLGSMLVYIAYLHKENDNTGTSLMYIFLSPATATVLLALPMLACINEVSIEGLQSGSQSAPTSLMGKLTWLDSWRGLRMLPTTVWWLCLAQMCTWFAVW